MTRPETRVMSALHQWHTATEAVHRLVGIPHPMHGDSDDPEALVGRDRARADPLRDHALPRDRHRHDDGRPREPRRRLQR